MQRVGGHDRRGEERESLRAHLFAEGERALGAPDADFALQIADGALELVVLVRELSLENAQLMVHDLLGEITSEQRFVVAP